MSRRRFGRVRRLPSGRWQARYRGPDGQDRPAPTTFDRRADADRWLAQAELEVVGGDWIDPEAGLVLLSDFAKQWLRHRAGLRPKTAQLYEGLIRLHILPALGSTPVSKLNPSRVRAWRSDLIDGGVSATTAAKAYRLLRTIMQTAMDDRLIRANPCNVRGAAVERPPERPVLTVRQVFSVADAIAPRYRLLILLATFASMRFGELAALKRGDLDVSEGLVHIKAGVVELGRGPLIVGPPKTAAGRRIVALPPALLPEAHRHLDEFVGTDPNTLVFAGPKGAPLRRSNFQKFWTPAIDAAGVDRAVHFHDLRHTGNTLAAQAGATMPDLMARMGHASTRAAQIYLHTSASRDRVVAAALNPLLEQVAGTGTRGARDLVATQDTAAEDDEGPGIRGF